MDMESVKASLTQKIGPLPAYAYAIIVIVIAYAIYWFRSRNSDPVAGVDYPDPTVQGFTSYDNPQSDYTGIVNGPSGTPSMQTNAEWAIRVTTALVAQGQYGAVAVSNAIAKYLEGKPLSDQEQAIISIAIQTYGVPPEGVLPIALEPAPTPTPTPTPTPAPAASGRSYTVISGDNLSRIAQRFYGVQNWQKIYNANRDIIKNPNLIYAGQVLWIPN